MSDLAPLIRTTSQRFFIHAGFHKTGTTSFQHFVHTNRQVLKQKFRIIGMAKLEAIIHAANGYSAFRDLFSLLKFKSRCINFFESLEIDNRIIFMSSEKLSGHLPGRGDIMDWSAAPILMGEMCKIIRAIYPNAEIHIYYTIRDRNSWMESAYHHLLRSTRMVLDWDDFKKDYQPASDFDRIGSDISKAIAPAHFVSRKVNDMDQYPLGTGQILADTYDLPKNLINQLQITPRRNQRLAPEAYPLLLALNREDIDQIERKSRRLELVEKFTQLHL